MKVFIIITIGAFFTGSIGAISVLRGGSVAGLLARANGEPLLVEPRVRDMGHVSSSKLGRTTFRITNLRSQEVTIVGVQTCCGCAPAELFPLKMAPHESRDITFDFATGGREFVYAVQLRLDIPSPPLFLSIRGKANDGECSGCSTE